MDSVVLSRRRLLGRGLASSAVAAMAALGIDLRPAQARAWSLRIAEAKHYPSVCPYCAVGCDTIIYVRDGAIVHIDGDPNSPINQGTLCPKGISLKEFINNDRRLTRPLYRGPGASEWKTVSWAEALDRMARLVKQSRDRGFIERDAEGRLVNRLENIALIGGCSSDGATSSLSSARAGSLADMRSQRPSTITAGNGWCPLSTASSAARAGAITSASSGVSV